MNNLLFFIIISLNRTLFTGRKKIRNLLYKLREDIYPSYIEYIKILSIEKINLGRANSDNNIFYIFPHQIILNGFKNNKTDLIIFLTRPFQLKMLKEIDILFVDGTFRSYPKNFYQVLNIIGKVKDKLLNIPILTVILNSKNEISYINIFENFNLLLSKIKIV